MSALKDPETCKLCTAVVYAPCETDAEQSKCELPDFCFPSRATGNEWLPIDTAPKDGIQVLLCHWENEADVLPVTSGFWSRLNEVWFSEVSGRYCAPTHWMPMPPPPQDVSE